jgi:hypothetical protein
MDATPEVTFRWLDGPDSHSPFPATEAEWQAIDAILVRQGWMSLNRVITRVLIAECDSQIVGLSVIQMLPMLGPIYVDKGQRGTGVADHLAADTVAFMLQSQARGWIVVADSPHSERLAKAQGMSRLESPVYVAGLASTAPSDKVH